jgi:hypothetical protein
MPTKTITDNGDVNFGIDAKSDSGYRVMMYSGDLGGGTLKLFTKPNDAAAKVPVPNGELAAATLDDGGDVVQQFVFMSAGQVIVNLAGATDPDLEVSVL